MSTILPDRLVYTHVTWSTYQLEVVEPVLEGDSLVTDVVRVEELLDHHGDKVLCVMSTTSCFAPRTPDKYVI